MLHSSSNRQSDGTKRTGARSSSGRQSAPLCSLIGSSYTVCSEQGSLLCLPPQRGSSPLHARPFTGTSLHFLSSAGEMLGLIDGRPSSGNRLPAAPPCWSTHARLASPRHANLLSRDLWNEKRKPKGVECRQHQHHHLMDNGNQDGGHPMASMRVRTRKNKLRRVEIPVPSLCH